MGLWNTVESVQFAAAPNTPQAASFQLRGGNYWVETLSSMSGVFTAATNATSTQVVVIGAVTYRIMTTPVAANDVQLGVDAATTLANLIATINGTGGIGAAGGANVAFTGTVSPAATVRAQAQTATQVTNKAVTFYSLVKGATGNLTTTTTVTSATWTAATMAATGITIDLTKLNLDKTTYTARITRITLSVGQQTLTLAPGTYRWEIAITPSSNLEITRIPTAVE